MPGTIPLEKRVAPAPLLLHLDKWLTVNARERRMITYLMQFRLKVKYLHGCHNASADCLSRLFTDMSPEDQKEFLPDLNDKDDFIVCD